ncbi:MAG: toxin-antitoxin system HicB family antitoxin, partial [Chloroflexota bacterium]
STELRKPSFQFLEFPGCFAEGNTADEAIHNLEAAAESWIEVSLAKGQEIPEPAMNQGYGGKVALRLPRSLHRQAARMADRDGVSLNQFLVTAIAARLGAEDFYSRLCDKMEQRYWKASTNVALFLKFDMISTLSTYQKTGIESLTGPFVPQMSASNRELTEVFSNA